MTFARFVGDRSTAITEQPGHRHSAEAGADSIVAKPRLHPQTLQTPHGKRAVLRVLDHTSESTGKHPIVWI
jgi:hypothetical protein